MRSKKKPATTNKMSVAHDTTLSVFSRRYRQTTATTRAPRMSDHRRSEPSRADHIPEMEYSKGVNVALFSAT